MLTVSFCATVLAEIGCPGAGLGTLIEVRPFCIRGFSKLRSAQKPLSSADGP
jgi:hypothetical protein